MRRVLSLLVGRTSVFSRAVTVRPTLTVGIAPTLRRLPGLAPTPQLSDLVTFDALTLLIKLVLNPLRVVREGGKLAAKDIGVLPLHPENHPRLCLKNHRGEVVVAP